MKKKRNKTDPKPLHKQVAASSEDIFLSPSLARTGKEEAVCASSMKAKDNSSSQSARLSTDAQSKGSSNDMGISLLSGTDEDGSDNVSYSSEERRAELMRVLERQGPNNASPPLPKAERVPHRAHEIRQQANAAAKQALDKILFLSSSLPNQAMARHR